MFLFRKEHDNMSQLGHACLQTAATPATGMP